MKTVSVHEIFEGLRIFQPISVEAGHATGSSDDSFESETDRCSSALPRSNTVKTLNLGSP